MLNDAHALTEAVGTELRAQELAGLHYAGRRAAAELVDLAPSARRAVLLRVHVAVQLQHDELQLSLDLGSLLEAGISAATRVHLTVPASLKRRGYELRLVMQPSPAEATAPDPGLVALIARAHAAREQLISGDLTDVRVNARKHLIHIARLSYLAPDIITAILDGRQPLGMTAQKLVKAGHIPRCWAEQRKMLGF